MPIEAFIEPDEIIAGGVVIYGQTYTVRHNQLSGNTQAKLRRLREMLQELAFDNRMHTDDLPLDDPEHPDHPDNESLGYNEWDDPFWRSTDGSFIDEKRFYYRQNPQNLWLIHRAKICDIILLLENDPTLGGNDRYLITVMRL